jgi:hypothetical protein
VASEDAEGGAHGFAAQVPGAGGQQKASHLVCALATLLVGGETARTAGPLMLMLCWVRAAASRAQRVQTLPVLRRRALLLPAAPASGAFELEKGRALLPSGRGEAAALLWFFFDMEPSSGTPTWGNGQRRRRQFRYESYGRGHPAVSAYGSACATRQAGPEPGASHRYFEVC